MTFLLSIPLLISGIQSFTINTPTAKLVLKSSLDYEHTTSYLLTLTITDTGKVAQPSGNIIIKVKVQRFFFFIFFTFLQVFDLLMNGSDLIKKVSDNTMLFRTKMTAAGFNIIVSKLTASLKI